MPPPWEPAAKPARSHGGLEAFGSHTPHSLDGGIAYKPLTRGWVLFTLSKRELGLLLDEGATVDFQTYSLLLCASRTGLRRGEVFALKWGDFDFNSRFVEVRRAIVWGRLTTPKTHQLRRVDVSQQLGKTLRELRRRRKEEYLAKGKEMPEWVFVSRMGKPIDQDNFKNRLFNRLLEKAGMRHIRFHDLRHTFASLLIQQGESLAYVQEQLGHASIQITVDVYGHLIPGSNRQAALFPCLQFPTSLQASRPRAGKGKPRGHCPKRPHRLSVCIVFSSVADFSSHALFWAERRRISPRSDAPVKKQYAKLSRALR